MEVTATEQIDDVSPPADIVAAHARELGEDTAPIEDKATDEKTDEKPKAPRAIKKTPPVKTEPAQASPEMRELDRGASKAIRDVLESLNGVPFQIHITRKLPDEVEDPDTGKWVTTKGFLKMVDHAIDEEWVQKKFGGGTYEIMFKKPGPKGGYVYAGMTTITIAGDPNLNELRRTNKKADAAAAAAPAIEQPSVVGRALDMLAKSNERAEARAEAAANAPRSSANDTVIEILREQNAALQHKLDQLTSRLNQPPPKSEESQFAQQFALNMMNGESARMQQMRSQLDSELRQLKDMHNDEIKRLHDRHDRELQAARQQNERELASLRSSQEVALQAVRSSTEVQIATAKTTYDTQLSLIKADLERLRLENSEQRTELKELRAKKDKSPIEMIKDMAAIKDALGVDDGDDEPKGVAAQLAEAAMNPAVWDGISGVLGRKAEPAAPPPPERQQRRDRVVKVHGQKMILKANGELEPAKPKQIEATPGEPQLPEVDPAVLATMIQLMEGAYTAGQEPAVVAQSARSRVPEDLITAIRDHGVDVVMTKMAKLSSTSPLSSTRGRQWVRALGEALVG